MRIGPAIVACLALLRMPALAQEPVTRNPRLSVEQRVDDLISKMTLEEKISQMVNDAPAIPRLGIPEYNWWNECLHGVGRAGLATVFPQAIGLAATWDVDLMSRVAPLEAGKSYSIRIEYFEIAGDAFLSLLWAVPGRDFEKEALETAKRADMIVMFMGLSPRIEGEEMNVAVEGFKGGDRMTLNLPAIQENLMQKIRALGRPTVLVLLNGSAVAVNWANDYIPAILTAWYPGQAAGTAIADILFGDANPGGRLPVTYYRSVEDLPPFEDYNMARRTYRYFKGEVLYPFGHGMSYTKFKYSKLTVPREINPGQSVAVTVEVENIGERSGDEVVQLYLSALDASVPVPIRSLQGFQRIALGPGGRKKLQFTLTPQQISVLDKNYERVFEQGFYEVAVGGKQPGFTGTADAPTTDVVKGRFLMRGKLN